MDAVVKLPFDIHPLQSPAESPEQTGVPQKHDYFLILWIKQGNGTLFIDTERFEISGGTVFCISPGQVYLFKSEAMVEGLAISFSSEFICLTENNYDLLFTTGLFYTFNKSTVIKLPEDAKDQLDDVMQNLQREFSNFSFMRTEVLRSFLKILLLYLTRHMPQPLEPGQSAKSMELVRNFFALLHKNYASKKMVAEYAEDLSISANHLNEVVKKSTGLPASEHIKQRVVLEAKRQAVYSDMTMKEIAFSLGFEDLAHFSKFFKNASGRSFSDYRKEITQMLN